MNKLKIYKKIASIVIIGFIIFSIYLVYDASNVWAEYKFNDEYYYLKRQLIYGLLAIISYFIARKIDILKYKKYFIPILIVCNILLVLVLIPGIGIMKGGSYSWLGFSFLSFQPSEIYKLSLITFTSYFLDKYYLKIKSIKHIIPLLIVLLVGAILIMLQPDFGTLVVIFSSVVVLLFLTKIKLSYFFVGGFFVVVIGIVMILIEPYRIDRIISFVDPFKDPLGSGFQIIQSLFAIGPGGLLGQGLNSSIQKYYYLPEPQTDFIFAILVEEFGLIGGVITILMYFYLFYILFKIAKLKNNQFNFLLSMGLLSLVVIQVVINLGVVTSLFPVTGITLPFLSYGGSSLIMLSFSMGLIVGE